MTSGNIILKRLKRDFCASFCLVNEELPDLVQHLSLLHARENEYYQSLKFDRRKKSYLLGRVAAKKAIAVLTGPGNADSVYVDFGIFEFPVVKNLMGHSIQVSISHCDNIGVVLAFPEEHPMAIDIEKIDNQRKDAMRSQLKDKELDIVSCFNLSMTERYTIIWTIKESLSKIFRTGLTMDLKQLEIESFTKTGPVYTSYFVNCIQYKAISCTASEYVCSIALPRETSPDLDLFWNSFKQVVQKKKDERNPF